MQRSITRFITRFALLASLSLPYIGCTKDATTPSETPPPSFASGPEVTLNGPDSIWVNGNYTYQAQLFGSYVWFEWAVRHCPTLTVSSCTTAWQFAQASTIDRYTTRYTTFLARDCSAAGKRSFQVRVIGHAFGFVQTKYKVTKLCGTNPV